MFRRPFFSKNAQGERDFRWRGGDVSRVEGLTDAVFALSLTLIVVSLSVPSTFAELLEDFKQLPVFAATFAILYWIWSCHFKFHRRYGLEDNATLWLNAALVFVVLLYVYPLQFLFSLIWNSMILRRGWGVLDGVGQPVLDEAGDGIAILARGDMGSLMLLYGCGLGVIFLLLAAMTWRALRLRDALELDAREVCVTRNTIIGHLLTVGLAALSVAISLFAPFEARHLVAGLVYSLTGPAHAIWGPLGARRVMALRPAVEEDG